MTTTATTITTTPKTKTTKPKSVTKKELFKEIAKRTDNHTTAVEEVFNALVEFVVEQLSPDGPGVVIIPEIVKIRSRVVAAKPERQVRNPSTGESVTASPKPGYVKAVASPVAKFKRAVASTHA